MGSRVIGFRVPDDLAGELERVSGERGMTTAEFLRKLVDDTIYPSNHEQTASLADTSIGEQIDKLEDTQSWLNDEIGNISRRMDKLTEKIGQLEAKDALSPGQTAMINTSANLASRVKDLEQRQEKMYLALDQNTNGVRGATAMAQDFGDSADNNFGKLRSEISTLRTKLEALNSLPTRVETIISDVAHISGRLSKVEREAKRMPTGETETYRSSNGREHVYRVYKSPVGLTKPYRLSPGFPYSKYIDLNEPLK